MTEATHFSQCVHDQQRRLEAEDCDSIRCHFRWEETYTPTMHSASLTLAHNALHSPSYASHNYKSARSIYARKCDRDRRY